MAEQSLNHEKLVRKIRKKLRQIETLEFSDRELNQEEIDKVRKKSSLRAELNELLKTIERTEIENDGFTLIEAEEDKSTEIEMKRKSSEVCANNSKKKSKDTVDSDRIETTTETESVEVTKQVRQVEESENVSDETNVNNPTTSNVQPSTDTKNIVESDAATKLKQLKSLKSKLEKSYWNTSCLEGHEDLVLDCDLYKCEDDRVLCVTASRDTTVKVRG